MTTTRIQIRRDTAANWAASNPILADGELGFIEDTGELKIGDGVTPWVDRPTLFVGGGVFRGTFQANTFYRAYDMIVQGGNTVSAIADFTSGSVYVSSDWQDFAVTLPSKINVSEKGAASGVTPLNASSKIDAMYLPSGTAVVQPLPYTMADGDAALGNGRWSPPVPSAITLASFRAAAEVGPDGQAINVDLQALGTGTIATASIPVGSSGPQKSSLVTPSTTSFPSGSQFRTVVTQVGVQPSSVTPSIVGRQTESTTTGTTKSVAAPPTSGGSAVQNGDLMVVSIRSNATAPDTVPTGWTLLPYTGTTPNGSFYPRRWWKLYAGETGPYVWDFTTAGSQSFGNTSLVWIRGAYQASPIDAQSTAFIATTTGAMTPPALTTNFDGSLDLYFWTISATATSTTGTPTGYTAYAGFTSTSVAHLGYRTQATAGALSQPTVTPSVNTSGVITRLAVRASPVTTWTPGSNLSAMIGFTV